ncbi:hypothetical protein [Agreia sp. COWG]|uniref:hypothetical protein n=1 Tax=Agreia sp. COWG TaxID=2773266 RepID=UPI001928FC60|nr:hypothetical protein [Agreia sp. COWG]CAD5999166.1 conserved protein of unknown function [Agreia sp. COWG]
MDTAQLIVSLLGAGGGGAVLIALVNGIMKQLSGAAGRERVRNTSLEAQRVKAIEERDKAFRDREDAVADAALERDAEARKRRKTEEYASVLRRQLNEAGIEPAPWPAETA